MNEDVGEIPAVTSSGPMTHPTPAKGTAAQGKKKGKGKKVQAADTSDASESPAGTLVSPNDSVISANATVQPGSAVTLSISPVARNFSGGDETISPDHAGGEERWASADLLSPPPDAEPDTGAVPADLAATFNLVAEPPAVAAPALERKARDEPVRHAGGAEVCAHSSSQPATPTRRVRLVREEGRDVSSQYRGGESNRCCRSPSRRGGQVRPAIL
mgnify:CR=1 FL=1